MQRNIAAVAFQLGRCMPSMTPLLASRRSPTMAVWLGLALLGLLRRTSRTPNVGRPLSFCRA